MSYKHEYFVENINIININKTKKTIFHNTKKIYKI